MKRRTQIDWSKHEVTEIKEDHSLIYKIKIPGSSTNSVIFINSCGVLAVTGDFGNWIFCREFHPSEEGEVSDGYWCEKMRISSCQKPGKYDAEETKKELQAALDNLEHEYGDAKHKESFKEYLEQGIELVDDELDYTYHAYRQLPSNWDYESVIFCKSTDYWLDAIFDAFEEICLRMKTKKQNL